MSAVLIKAIVIVVAAAIVGWMIQMIHKEQ